MVVSLAVESWIDQLLCLRQGQMMTRKRRHSYV